MPILQVPAHEIDTLNTVVKRYMHISAALGQQYTVITVDQALFCKLLELKWSIPEYQNKLVVQLGGSSYINVLPESDWKPYEWIRLGRNMGRKWTSWSKCHRACYERKSLQKSNVSSQDHSAVIVAAADAFPARFLPEIAPGSFPRAIGP